MKFLIVALLISQVPVPPVVPTGKTSRSIKPIHQYKYKHTKPKVKKKALCPIMPEEFTCPIPDTDRQGWIETKKGSKKYKK